MRAYLKDYRYLRPSSLEEALKILDEEENITPIAGGTDLMVYLEAGQLPPTTFLDLSGIEDLPELPELREDELILYPLTTYRHIRKDPEIRQTFPMLEKAAREVGVIAIQSRGTWIGNIVNASPAADGVPALMAYDARLKLRSLEGEREVNLSQFYQGYKQMDLKKNELVVEVRIPRPATGWREYYRKVGTRLAQAISKTLLAGRIKMNERKIEDIRLVYASVAPYTLRAVKTEEVLRGKELNSELIEEACQTLETEISPIDDIRSTREYRKIVSCNLLRDFLEES